MTLAFLSVENYNAINGWGTAQRPSCSLRRTEAEVTSNRCYIYPQAPLSLALVKSQGGVSHTPNAGRDPEAGSVWMQSLELSSKNGEG